MQQRTLVIIITLVILISLPVGSVLWTRHRLAAAASQIMALAPGKFGRIADDIAAFGYDPKSKYRGLISKPFLFPFGSWALTNDGNIVWLTNADIEEMKKLS